MTWKSKAVAALALIEGIVLVVLFIGWYLNGQLSDQGMPSMCGGQVYHSATSPDKQLTAYSAERDCGATTGFSTLVTIRSAQENVNLSADLGAEVVFHSEGDYKPQVEWLSNNRLSIVFDPKDAPTASEIWHQDVVHQQIRIIYSGLPSGT